MAFRWWVDDGQPFVLFLGMVVKYLHPKRVKILGVQNFFADNMQAKIQIRKHMTCDVTFAIVRAQPYWKLYPYAVSFMLFLHNTKVAKATNRFVS